MLLDRKRPRVKRDAEERNIRQVASPGFANGESQHLGDNLFSKDSIQAQNVTGIKNCTNLTDGDGGVSEEKELVHAGNEDSPDETDDPSTESRRRHRGIVCVGNRRTDFWIWGFILKGKGGWVKVWVVKFIDGDALLVLRVFG